MCEDKVLGPIGKTNRSSVERSVGNVGIKSLEEEAGSGGGGGDDDMVLAHFEVHDGAIAPGETGQGGVGVGAKQREAAEEGVAGGARGEGARLGGEEEGEEAAEEEEEERKEEELFQRGRLHGGVVDAQAQRH